MKGRKPQPIEQRIITGNRQHKPLPETVLVGGRPEITDLAEPPEDLPRDAQRLWRRDVTKLVDAGIVDLVDVGALEALCTSYARAKQASRVIKAEGLFTGGTGGLREHPAVKIERDSWSMFLKLAEQYALTPIARTRLGLAELGRRSLADELHKKLGPPDLTPA